MSGTLSIDGTLGLIVLALPIVMLAIVILWSMSAPAAYDTTGASAPSGVQTKTHEQPLAGPRQPSGISGSDGPIAKDHDTHDELKAVSAASPLDGGAVGSTAARPSAGEVIHAVPAVSLQEPAGDTADAVNAEALIEKGKVEAEAGNADQAANLLGEAITVAAQAKLHAVHARARLELAEVFLAKSDPITACEQWQIARNLYHDLEQIEARDNVDKKMLSSGCPTDWVLTDF